MPEHASSLDHTATIDALESVLATTVALAADTPGDLPVPTCPGWDAAALWTHLGTVHRWAAEIVATRSDVRIPFRDIALHLPDDGLWAPWLADGADVLLAALRDTAGDEPMWVWADDPRATWWARRQLHETLVHNADAARALGRDVDVRPDIAADGIDELLDNLPARLSRRSGDAPPLPALTAHLHATEADLGDAGEWMVTVAADSVVYTHGHGKGDVALRGPVGDLLLAAYGRTPPTDAALELLGDGATWAQFLGVVKLG